MIAPLLALIVAIASPAPSSTPSPAPSPAVLPSVSTLPTIEQGEALPYPAVGTPQPQIVVRKAVPNVATNLTLDQAIAIAIARLPALAAARAEILVGDAAILSEKTGLAPSLGATVSSTGSLTQGGASGSSNPYALANELDISLSQLIFDGGKIRAAIEAATFSRDADIATFKREAQTVAYDAASAYYTLLADQRTVSVDLELVREDEVSEDLVRARIQAGTEAGVDLTAQQATTANARTALVTAQGAAQSARVAFATALGIPADADVSPIDDAIGLENASPPVSLPAYNTELTIAYVERGDLLSDRDLISSSQASLRSARLGMVPTISLGGAKSVASSGQFGGAYRNFGQLGLTATIPILDQGVTRANVAAAKANLAIDQANTDTVRATVQSDVRNAMISVVSDGSTLDQARAAYAAAKATLEQTQGQFGVGVTTLPSLITSEATLAQASTNIVTAIYTFRLAQANLRYALGTNLMVTK